MPENEIGGIVVDSAITVHRALRSGLPESECEVLLVRDWCWRQVPDVR